MNSSTRFLVIVFVIALVSLPARVQAFGAGSMVSQRCTEVAILTRDRYRLYICY
jgi:hypothetical protein